MKKISLALICLIIVSCSVFVSDDNYQIEVDGTKLSFDVTEGYRLNQYVSTNESASNIRDSATEGHLDFSLISSNGLSKTTYSQNGNKKSCNGFSQVVKKHVYSQASDMLKVYAISKDCLETLDTGGMKCLTLDTVNVSEIEPVILENRHKIYKDKNDPGLKIDPVPVWSCSYFSTYVQTLGYWKTLKEASKDGNDFKIIEKKELDKGKLYLLTQKYSDCNPNCVLKDQYSVLFDMGSYTKNGFKTIVFTSSNKEHMEKIFDSLRIVK